jgi:putative MATE family efflux protein
MSVSLPITKPVSEERKTPTPADRQQLARQAILSGSVLPVMVKLALPTVIVLVVQTLVGVVEAFYVSFLGTSAQAGVTLVFPVFMLMAMMSAGGIGGGVAAAIARAIGAGRKDDADALVQHTLALAVVFGILFTVGELLLGPVLYHALGGRGAALAAALTYSTYVFIGAVPIWIVNLLSAALRGAGDVKTPARVILAGAAALIPLSPALIFGFGPIPRLGIAGAGVAMILYYSVASVVLLRFMSSGRSNVTLRTGRYEARLFRDILGVGVISALQAVQTNLNVVLVTGAVGLFGTEALAGYGIASRLDYVLVPLMFGLGTALVTMVGVNIGAGDVARARRIAWTGAILAAVVTEAIGLAAALFPGAWLGLFSHDAAVVASGTSYLRVVGPFYGVIGFGFLLYFASMGAGRVVWPFLAGSVRLTVAAGVGWLAVALFKATLLNLYLIVGASAAFYGVAMLVVFVTASWKRRFPA